MPAATRSLRAMRPTEKDLQQQVDAFNRAHPEIGTAVSVVRDNGTATLTTTRSAAFVMNGHSAVIMLEGISGCYLLSRVSAIGAVLPAFGAAGVAAEQAGAGA